MPGVRFAALLLFLLHFNLRKVQAVKCDAEYKDDQGAYKDCITRAYPPETQQVLNTCWDNVFAEACKEKPEAECCLCPANICQVTLCIYDNLDEATAKSVSERADLCYTERFVKDEVAMQDCMSSEILAMPRADEIIDIVQGCFFDDMDKLTSTDVKEKCAATINLQHCGRKRGMTDEEIEVMAGSFIHCIKKAKKNPSDFTQV